MKFGLIILSSLLLANFSPLYGQAGRDGITQQSIIDTAATIRDPELLDNPALAGVMSNFYGYLTHASSEVVHAAQAACPRIAAPLAHIVMHSTNHQNILLAIRILQTMVRYVSFTQRDSQFDSPNSTLAIAALGDIVRTTPYRLELWSIILPRITPHEQTDSPPQVELALQVLSLLQDVAVSIPVSALLATKRDALANHTVTERNLKGNPKDPDYLRRRQYYQNMLRLITNLLNSEALTRSKIFQTQQGANYKGLVAVLIHFYQLDPKGEHLEQTGLRDASLLPNLRRLRQLLASPNVEDMDSVSDVNVDPDPTTEEAETTAEIADEDRPQAMPSSQSNTTVALLDRAIEIGQSLHEAGDAAPVTLSTKTTISVEQQTTLFRTNGVMLRALQTYYSYITNPALKAALSEDQAKRYIVLLNATAGVTLSNIQMLFSKQPTITALERYRTQLGLKPNRLTELLVTASKARELPESTRRNIYHHNAMVVQAKMQLMASQLKAVETAPQFAELDMQVLTVRLGQSPVLQQMAARIIVLPDSAQRTLAIAKFEAALTSNTRQTTKARSRARGTEATADFAPRTVYSFSDSLIAMLQDSVFNDFTQPSAISSVASTLVLPHGYNAIGSANILWFSNPVAVIGDAARAMAMDPQLFIRTMQQVAARAPLMNR